MAGQHRTLAEEYLGRTGERSAYRSMPEITHRHASASDSRPGWDDLGKDLQKDLEAEGEKAAGMAWPVILASDYMEFSRTGNRVHFEDKYFQRRRMLTALVMAECAQNQGKFVSKIVDGLYLILEETTWCLPPHNGYIRDSVVYPLPDVTRPVIDLFAAETAAIISVAEYLLRPVLEKISPLISRYVNELLRSRIIVPYLTFHFWWMGGEGQMLNWTPWITQNVLLAAATRPEGVLSGQEKEAILRQAATSVDYFLDEYGDDGCCSEGAQYYTHAGLCLYGCLHLISALTGDSGKEGPGEEDKNRFSAIFQEPLIFNIATYIVNMYVGGRYYINFADCSPFPGRRCARDFLFAKAVGSEVMASFCARDFRDQTREERLDSEEENLWYHVLGTFTYEEMLQYPQTPAQPGDVWYPSNGIMIARTATARYADAEGRERKTQADNEKLALRTGGASAFYVLAAKAGSNADAHNHNDVGSVTLYKNNHPYLIDLGVETYTAKTFSADRYDIWTMQSQYHNTPFFLDPATLTDQAQTKPAASLTDQPQTNAAEGLTDRPQSSAAGRSDGVHGGSTTSPAGRIIQQKDGAAYAAKNITCRLGTDACMLQEDIAPAYPDPRIRSYQRTVTLHKTPGDNTPPITIEDHYDGDLPCVLSLMTYEKPTLCCVSETGEPGEMDGTHEDSRTDTPDTTDTTRIQIGTLGQITATGIGRAEIQTCPIHDARLAIAWKHDCYRILLYMKGNEVELSIR